VRFQAIRSQNQDRFRSSSEVDGLHEAHLKRFLDVSLFAARIRREVKAMTDSKQRREEALRREEQLREDAQRAAASAHSSGQLPSSPGQAGDQRAGTPSPAHSSANQAQSGAPRAATSGQAQAAATSTDASPAHSQGGRRRNHHRSRRLGKLKKTPVGAPPPDLPEETLLDAGDSARPLLFPSGIGRGSSGKERERA